MKKQARITGTVEYREGDGANISDDCRTPWLNRRFAALTVDR